MSEASDRQMAALQPRDADSLKEFRRVVGTALRVMIHDRLPASEMVDAKVVRKPNGDGIKYTGLILGRRDQREQVPAVLVTSGSSFDRVVVWVHPEGKSSLMHDGKLTPAAQHILDRKAAILSADLFLTGEFNGAKAPGVNGQYAGYTFGYNRPLLANRVHDLLTTIAFARKEANGKPVDLIGFDKAGPWVLLARALCGEAVARTVVDGNRFRFEDVMTVTDEMMLPGALKYGGLPAVAALCAPGDLFLHHDQSTGVAAFAADAYRAAGAAGRLQHRAEKVDAEKAVAWLVR
jgi:hypothetical protein